MHKLLVPIENFSGLALSATYFAIEFAKRNPAKIFFLLFSAQKGEPPQPAALKTDLQRKQFEELVQGARSEKINLEMFHSNENFFEVINQFCKDHGLTEIIIALPADKDPAYHRFLEQVNQLRNSLETPLIVVKPKEEKAMTSEREEGRAGQTPPQKTRSAVGGRKG